MTSLRARWHNLLYGFWFVPGTTVVLLGTVALLLVRVDRAYGTGGIDLLFGGDASAARSVLSTIAGATATIAGVVFSITIVTLQLVSSQFTPRALRGFLQDRVNQGTAGIFVGTFVYCLLVLRTIRSDDNGAGGEFVPSLAVTSAILLGVGSLLVLLLFVHHVSDSIQVSTIAERMGRDASRSLERLYPDPHGKADDEQEGERLLAAWADEEEPTVVRAGRPGYVQSIELDGLVEDLATPALRLHVRVRPGDLVTARTVLLEAWGAAPDPDTLRSEVHGAIAVTSQRDSRQDLAFTLRQLADIAIRALSPSVNDPTTAITCIGYLRSALEELACRNLPATVRRFDDGVVAVVARRSFAEFVDESARDVGRHAAREPRVARELLATFAAIADAAVSAGAVERAAEVVDAAEELARAAAESTASAHDRELLERTFSSVLEAAGATSQR